MFYTYVLKSEKDKKWYIGHTQDLNKRLSEHNSGKVFSTKTRIPFILLYYQTFSSKNEARWQERTWKTAAGHEKLRKLLSFQIAEKSSRARSSVW